MAQNLTNFDKVLKDYYEGPVREHLNNKVTILKYTEKSSRKWQGRAVVFPINLSRNSGVGARGASGTLPSAGNQGYVESRIGSKFLYGRIEVSGPVIAASRGDKGAFVSALKSEISGMRRDLRVDMARQTYGNNTNGLSDGATTLGMQTGVVAQANGGTVNVVATAGGTAVTFDNPGTRYLKKGMRLQIGLKTDLDGDTDAFEVVSVTSPTVAVLKHIETGGGTKAVNDNNFVARGDTGGNSFDSEIMGLDFMVSDQGTLQTIDPSTDPEWKANVLSGPGGGATRPLSLELMQLAIDNTDEVSGEEPDLIIGHHSIRREYINLLTSDVRYAPEQLKGGFQKLTYSGGTNPITFEFDRYAPYNKVYFLHTKDIKQYVLQDWKWADRDGSVMNRVANQDSWEAFMCWYGNLGLDRRHSQTVLQDISVSNTLF